MPPARLLAVFAVIPLISARLLHSLPEDTYAFPKYKVSFLSQLPLANKTAEHWLKHGLTGGLSEFLDQPSSSHKRISSHDDDDHSEPQPYSDYTLEHMRMGRNDSYLCLIPKALDPPVSTTPEPELDISPAHSWSLLEPLNGNCLYHRQGWFTYSYCHNSEIRQFKERLNPHLNAPGGYKPEEDPKWESYTLGRAPQTGTDVAVRDGTVQLANGGAGGSRYLVQTWGDGTMCDKSGKPREVQVQFHCSMTMSDHILFVKEAKTCSYVLVINTPRLCSEPGFKSTRDVAEQGSIQCREVVDEASVPQRTPSDGKEAEDYPRKMLKPNAQLPPPAPKDKVPTDSRPGAGANTQIQYDDILDKAMTALQDAAGLDLGNGKLVMTEDGGVVLEFINEVPEELSEEEELANDALIDRLMEVLKKAGIQLQGEDGEVEQEDEEDKRPLDEL